MPTPTRSPIPSHSCILFALLGCFSCCNLLPFQFAAHGQENQTPTPQVVAAEVTFEFASISRGQEVLTTNDDFVQRLSTFDRQSRLQSAEAIEPEIYLRHVAAQVLQWTPQQVEKLSRVIASLSEPLQKIRLPNLPTVLLIQTTGREESGAAYTRGNAIVLTKAQLSQADDALQRLLLHELFHVISRTDPILRDQLYAIIGFQPTNEIALPESLRERRITNPDAPIIQHVIDWNDSSGKQTYFAPVLFARDSYDPQRQRSMFAYLEFQLMEVAVDDAQNYVAVTNDGTPKMLPPSHDAFQKKIGKNTGYIIHPEEILADNFALLMLGERDVPDGWILEKMLTILAPPRDDPICKWDFSSDAGVPFQSHGSVTQDAPGPRAPEYPDFSETNTAIYFAGDGGHLLVQDPGHSSPYDFENGDSITLEAWVQVEQIGAGQYQYIIGKGRSDAPQYARDNQNWALRIQGHKIPGGQPSAGETRAKLSFLFATPVNAGAAGDSHWHRWTSQESFSLAPNWHHVAIAYRFGQPESIRGWIDGKPTSGSWDMGGRTTKSPLVDNDSVWIGSARMGQTGNSFHGSIDELALHRELLSDSIMATRFRRLGAERTWGPAAELPPQFEADRLTKVHWSIIEGLPSHNRWLLENETLANASLTWQSQWMLMDRLPQAFDNWGIRESWRAPVLVRAASDVVLPRGKHRLLVRSRGLTRLWFDNQVVARCNPLTGSPSGEEPITPVLQPLVEGMRIAEHRQQEVVCDIDILDDQPHRICWETIVGGKEFRCDPGEACVAIQFEGSDIFRVISHNGRSPHDWLSLTDQQTVPALVELERELRAFDDQRRRKANATQRDYWDQRHELAREILATQPMPIVPEGTAPEGAGHPIDRFLQKRLDQVGPPATPTENEQALEFHERVLPLLREHCLRCHSDSEQTGFTIDHNLDSNAGEELLARITSSDAAVRMPPEGNGLPNDAIDVLTTWVQQGAAWPEPPLLASDIAQTPILEDGPFLRRLFLDTIGLLPTEADYIKFLADTRADKRAIWAKELLNDPRHADHEMGYWQDVLAENPTLINPSLNTTGPFRWFLVDAFRDRKPVDQWVTELVMLRGSLHEGGSAGFGIAADNDSPFAAKAQVLMSAFQGRETQCARCHDAPFHSILQQDLYQLAAMLEKKSITVPATSRVPSAFFQQQSRRSLIRVSLSSEQIIEPTWPFPQEVPGLNLQTASLRARTPEDPRELLAIYLTSAENRQFARTIVNRVWRQYFGAGFVEPPGDWEGQEASHPELLDWLATDFVMHDYDLNHLRLQILSSLAYQRTAGGNNRARPASRRYFASPDRRRMTAEQLVDCLYQVSGQAMELEELTFDPDGRRPASNRLSLGKPERAWMLASLANERDRPSLGLPKARAIVDVMEAFGWNGSRQNPLTDRETSPHLLQPGVMANSTAVTWWSRIAANSELAQLALQAENPEQLANSLAIRFLTRPFHPDEQKWVVAELAEGFEQRRASLIETSDLSARWQTLPSVTWSNHLVAEATTIALELERRAQLGPEVDVRFEPQWRERYEDVVWSLINLAEFLWIR